ncbi:MAG: PqqD family peptide modification chaperone [Deltaproteobacteria bacterium]|nr:PqqD family peptide modification chaperone [Deltaproteobacteria bacterium]MBW1737320.1 PqqD family peptide modification chaperone [Deltaproteobacteria bacterium]MBW1910187.1 PqqD family peptide modification chaperone [Deltaproteobacteria bacterium]MBW2032869.1 PqqD family peptide modification chaperone [Deltaproteobacteria bacterium]MBW2114697.1 PqqD family peptide modification chaperone [Deltaproteobacteria bacterium]
MKYHDLDKKFLVLKKDSFFVPGPKRGAIYDISAHRLYHLEERLAGILKRSLEGLSVKDAFTKVGIAREDEAKITLEMLLNMSCISMEAKAMAFPDVKIEKSPVKPRVAWLEPTDRCNLFCVHCYAESRLGRKDEELSTERWFSIIDELEEIGVEQIVVTGGEPLLRNDLLEILRRILSKEGLQYIQILTNASLFAPSPLLDFIAEKQVGVGISFYSHRPEVHDQVTRTPGSWEKTVNGIRLLVDKGISPAANIVLTKINERDENDTRKFLVSLGLENENIISNVVLPTGRGCHSDYQIKNYDYFIRKSYAFDNCFGPGGWKDYQGTCWRGKFTIKSNGKLSPCTMCREIELGDIRHNSLKKLIEEGAFDTVWDIDFDSTKGCSECELRYACSDCRALTYAFTGDLYAKDPTCPYDPHTGNPADLFFPPLFRSPSFSLKAKPKRREDIVHSRVGEELVLSNREEGIHHNLNAVAGEVWALLDGEHSLETVVDVIGQRFDRERSLLEKDIIQLAEQFARLGLLEHGL